MPLLKKDIKKLKEIYKETIVDDIQMEEYAGELSEKSDDYYEKEKDEKAEAYQEVAESLTELAEAYQRFVSALDDYEVIED